MRIHAAALAVLLIASVATAEPTPDQILEYKEVGGTKLQLHVFTPADHAASDKRPAIVFFFGGGWNGGTPKQFYPQSEHLAKRGMVALCAEYRVKSRHQASPQECLQDAKSAVRWVRAHADQLGVDPDKLVVSGGSAGGHLAAATATATGFDEPGEDTSVSCRASALVLFNPVFDNGPTGYGHDRVKAYWRDFSPLHNIDSQTPPTIVFLGDQDPLIPVATAEEYKSRMESAGGRCDLCVYEGERHGFFNKSKYAETTAEMDKFLVSLGLLEEEPHAASSQATESATPEQSDRDARLQWWREAKFGMFVHWGVYSVTGGEHHGRKLPNSAEWMMNRGKIPIAEYEQYAARFNPTKFNARQFVQRAKDAGMKYLVITAKHHDGFAMFDSHCNDFNVVDATPLKRDIMKELADECQRQGIRFGFYYSQAQDWHHPGGFGNNWDKSLQRVSNDQYVREKAVPEVKQLLTEYGPIAIFWWDTPRKMSRESFDSLHSLTSIQPAIITNDRLGEDYPGDYKTFERHIPKDAPAAEDWEVCMPISGSWGYKRSDTDFKSTTTLIQNLADIASKGGNYLLNVSPTGEGTLLPQAVERLEAIGQWMNVNGESIYDTTASPFGKFAWGRCTQRETGDATTLYLHVFDWPANGELLVPGLKSPVDKAYLLAGGAALETQMRDEGAAISLPSTAPDTRNSVIVMKVRGALQIESRTPTLSRQGSLVLSADTAYLHNNEGAPPIRIQSSDGVPNIGYWTDAQAWVEWSLKVDCPGRYEVWAELAVEEGATRFIVGLPTGHLPVEMAPTGGYDQYVNRRLGTISIDKAGEQMLKIRPDSAQWNPVNLRKLVLKAVAEGAD